MRSVVALGLTFAASISRAQDFQSWNEVDLTATVRNINLLVPLLARVDTQLPNPQLAATGMTVDFALPVHLTLTGGYLFAVLPQRSLDVHVPLVAVSESFHIRRLAFADRNRFEKLVGYGTSPVRYRNRFLIDRPFGAKERWHLFADDEIFFDLSAGAWNQNRFQVGGGTRLPSRLLLDIYYLQRNPSGGAPTTHVLGTTLRVTVK